MSKRWPHLRGTEGLESRLQPVRFTTEASLFDLRSSHGCSAGFQPNATNFWGARPRGSIPKGLHLSAQGCEERATLGETNNNPINPERVVSLGFQTCSTGDRLCELRAGFNWKTPAGL